jgi:hypothetical protein
MTDKPSLFKRLLWAVIGGTVFAVIGAACGLWDAMIGISNIEWYGGEIRNPDPIYLRNGAIGAVIGARDVSAFQAEFRRSGHSDLDGKEAQRF